MASLGVLGGGSLGILVWFLGSREAVLLFNDCTDEADCMMTPPASLSPSLMESPGTPVAAATVRRPQLAGEVAVDLLARPFVQHAIFIDGRTR